MTTLDYSKPFQQITDTVDYTEVIYLPTQDKFVVVWHDNIVFSSVDKQSAINEYKRLITRKPIHGDYR